MSIRLEVELEMLQELQKIHAALREIRKRLPAEPLIPEIVSLTLVPGPITSK